MRALDDAGVAVEDISLRRPTLDEVFLALTGRAAAKDDGVNGAGPNDSGTKDEGTKRAGSNDASTKEDAA